ncbi:prepilin-type N-terminal cleavage/methylation domain-containing protein [Roseateles sp.]|uniref:pilus assembly FimT family protein n=1 Tax=Roseateles sp. TaxID=1971397 RepID=UPI003263CBFC
MKRLHSPRARSGITLIEMVVGLAVVGVVVAAAIPSLTGMIERRRVVAAAGEIASIFAYAKSESNVVADPMSLHMEPVPSSVREYSSCLRLGQTAVIGDCACNLPPSAPCTIGTGAVLREFVIPRDQSVTFAPTEASSAGRKKYVLGFSRNNRYTGTQDVQIDVKGARTGATLRVEYNNAGRLRTCSPDGSMSGFPRC